MRARSRRARSAQGWAWPTFVERTQEAYRAYYQFVPKGKFKIEYTVRLNNPGRFDLPATRVEAMYAPEMFGELPNAARGGEAVTKRRASYGASTASTLALAARCGVAPASLRSRALPRRRISTPCARVARLRRVAARPPRRAAVARAHRSRSAGAATGSRAADVSPALDGDGARVRRQALPRARRRRLARARRGAIRQTRGGRAPRRQHAHDAACGVSQSRSSKRAAGAASSTSGARCARRSRSSGAGARTQILEAWLNLTPFRGEARRHRRGVARALRQARAGARSRRERAARGAGARAERAARVRGVLRAAARCGR